MKKFSRWPFLVSGLLMILFCFSLTGCGSSSEVVGTWYQYDSNGNYDNPKSVLEIKQDGTYTYTYDHGTFSGTWKLNDSVLTFTVDASKMASSGTLQDSYNNKKGRFIIITLDPGARDTVGEHTYERP